MCIEYSMTQGNYSSFAFLSVYSQLREGIMLSLIVTQN